MIKPLGVNVLVLKDPRGPHTERGILIPECAERTPRFAPVVYATVVAVGSKVTAFVAGQRVALKDYAGDDWEIEGKKYTMLRDKDLVGMVEAGA